MSDSAVDGTRGGVFSARFWGRGGQGVVTAAELLALAAFGEGRYAQAIPSFGSERMGAPVVAFCRIAARPIRTREPVMAPDAVVVADATLVHHVDLLGGIVDGGLVVVNTSRPVSELDLGGPTGPAAPATTIRVVAVPATELARRHVGRPVPNAPLLGALAELTGVVSLGAVEDALRDRFGADLAEGNVAAAHGGAEAARAGADTAPAGGGVQAGA